MPQLQPRHAARAALQWVRNNAPAVAAAVCVAMLMIATDGDGMAAAVTVLGGLFLAVVLAPLWLPLLAVVLGIPLTLWTWLQHARKRQRQR